MSKIFVLVLTFLVAHGALAETHFENPSHEDMAFMARASMKKNQASADRICFVLMHRKSFHASAFTTKKTSFQKLATQFPGTNSVQLVSWPKIIRDVVLEGGSFTPAGARGVYIDFLIRATAGEKTKVRYFNSITCE